MPKKVQQSDRSDKQNSREITPTVAAISDLQFQGVIIPHSWWIAPHLRYDSGRSNVVAALILADICYWYRATETRNGNGEIVARQKKFRSDKLQKSYAEWAEQFGVTKRQVQNAVAFLVGKGLITRELRTFVSAGRKFGNVTFFEPVTDAIKALTFDTLSLPKVIPLTSCGDTSHLQKQEVSPQEVRGITSKGETNTEITQKTNSQNWQVEPEEKHSANAGAGAPPADQPTSQPDANKTIWDLGVSLLKSAGEAEASARSFLGLKVKDYGREILAAAIVSTMAANPISPKEYLVKVLQGAAKKSAGSSYDQERERRARRHLDLRNTLEAERRARRPNR